MDLAQRRPSELIRWQRCRRSWYFAYHLGIEPRWEGEGIATPRSGERDTGSIFHAGVAAYYRGEDPATAARDELLRIALRNVPEDKRSPGAVLSHPEWQKVFRLAERMLEGYVEWLETEGIDVGRRLLHREWEWEVELPGLTTTLHGTADMVMFDDVVGAPVILDDKTVQSFTQVPEQVDFQLRTYAWAWWRLHGQVPYAVGHRMSRKVLRTASAQPPFYQETLLHMNEGILRAHETHLMARLLDIPRTEGATLFATDPRLFPHPTRDCSWDCDYRSICPMVDDGDDWESVVALSFTTKPAEREGSTL